MINILLHTQSIGVHHSIRSEFRVIRIYNFRQQLDFPAIVFCDIYGLAALKIVGLG